MAELRDQWRQVFWITAALNVFGAIVFAAWARGDVQPWAEVNTGGKTDTMSSTRSDQGLIRHEQIDITTTDVDKKQRHQYIDDATVFTNTLSVTLPQLVKNNNPHNGNVCVRWGKYGPASTSYCAENEAVLPEVSCRETESEDNIAATTTGTSPHLPPCIDLASDFSVAEESGPGDSLTSTNTLTACLSSMLTSTQATDGSHSQGPSANKSATLISNRSQSSANNRPVLYV